MILRIHPITPERYKIEEAARLVHKGALLLYPTDTGFALGCGLANKSAIERIRRLRKISDKKPLTFLCENLQSIANYAQVSNAAFKAIRKLTPGPYTFILPASRAVPKFVHDEKRKTVGIRIPNSAIATALLHACQSPIISISARLNDDDLVTEDYFDPTDILFAFENNVDVVIEPEWYEFTGESTVIDMTQDNFFISREGADSKALDKARDIIE
ncbi:MAG: L-threonylcarbamoyladenylate synthase [Candidatus Kapaibacterium sp.]|jgi:tRNA threonylcarbamoyl adenosine modification protein (Sua5/YciO/YrdC/YwlC family)|nr:threonylcarbamoyl-AMP synthase [Candidatus Kapabacteria bacterium]